MSIAAHRIDKALLSALAMTMVLPCWGQGLGQSSGGGNPGTFNFGGSSGSGRDPSDGPDLFTNPYKYIRDDKETWGQRFVTDRLWEQKLIDRPVAGPVRVGDRVLLAFSNRKLASYHFGDGSADWSIEIPGDLAGALVLGPEREGETRDVFITTLQGDALRIRTADGSTVFRAHLAQEIRREPAVTAEAVIVAGKDDLVFALNSKDGSIRWKGATGGTGLTSPACAGDRVVVCDDAGVVHALSLVDGKVAWTFKTGGGITAPAAVTDDHIFVVSGDRKVYCLDPKDGDRSWSHLLGASATAPPLAHDAYVYVATHDNLLSALRKGNGYRKWKQKLPRRVTAPMLVEGDIVYVTPFAGRDVLSFRAKNGYPMGQLTLKTSDDYGVGEALVTETSILYATYGRTLSRFKKITSKQIAEGEDELPAPDTTSSTSGSTSLGSTGPGTSSSTPPKAGTLGDPGKKP